ncbi:MAG TPA: class I SAM-dependent methyltransferase [Rhizomicrobium sp.]|nr:class I SAM-dependent methyltransferase [Rhizomicrobium sp.]
MSMRAVPSLENHSGLMDQVYRHQRYIYDLTRKYYLFGRDSLIRELALKPGDRLIEIGCGTARNLIAIARRYPDARLFGLDASAEMLETAARQLRRAGLEGQVMLRHGLAEDLVPSLYGEDGFEHALFSYSLSMIPDWRRALAASRQALSEQGVVHVVDFADLRDLPGRSLLRSWLKLFHVNPRGELLEELEASHGRALTFLPGRYAFRTSFNKGKTAA